MAVSNDTPNLPARSWTEGLKLTKADGEKIPRWGSVRKACQVLDNCDREVIYDLIAVGAIIAFKLKPHRPNSHWKVDLLSVWNHRQKQIQERT